MAVSRRPVNVEILFSPGAGHVGILVDKVPRRYRIADLLFQCR